MVFYLRYLLMLFVFFLVLQCSTHAQDTESKDDPTYIMVYIKLQVEASPCGLCYDSLSAKVKRIPGAKAVQTDIVNSTIQFQLHSSMLINEHSLMLLAKESDLVPVEVLFEKEEPAEEDDEPIIF